MAELLQGIAVVLRDGVTKLHVICDTVVGDYAVHRFIWGKAPSEMAWTVTHVASGIAMWSVAELRDAVRVAQWLEKSQVVPKGEEQAVAWIERLRDPEKSRLIKALADIAPKFNPMQ